MYLNWLDLTNPVALWWIFLVFASIVNITAWLWTKSYLSLNSPFKNIFHFGLRNESMIWYCAAYVFGCAYRSVFPKADVQRIALFDSWLSSVFLGRTVATVAELCFVMQWALVIRFLSAQTHNSMARTISFLIVPIICVAECFSWFAVITTNYIGNTVEESLWAVTYALILIALVSLVKYFTGAFKQAMYFSIFGCAAYIGFMTLVDVPMYFNRWRADQAAQKIYFSFTQGLIDLNSRWIVTYDISEWKTEIPWMTLYFSFAVLVSIAICYVPLNLEKMKKHLKESCVPEKT